MRFFITVILYFTILNLQAQNLIDITKLTSGLKIPVDIAHAGDDRIFILEKAGTVRIYQNGKLSYSNFLNITPNVNSRGNEQGLLGIAFHPDFQNNGLFFVNYINKSTPAATIVSRFKMLNPKSNYIDSSTEEIILSIDQPFSNHNGGCLKFGKDGYLYIGMGDGGSANDPNNNGQSTNTLLGKMLRIDVNTTNGYSIPKTNPYATSTTIKKEIWAIGMRNPWRFSFDKLTGDMWIGDVGQGEWEEVDFEKYPSNGGLNYGWRCYEGNQNFNTNGCNSKSNYTFPIHEYHSDQANEGCSITGGYVYRGTENSSFYGRYIFADYCSGRIWWLNKTNDTTSSATQIYKFGANQISTFGEDYNGEIYFAAITEGSIYKLSQKCNLGIDSVDIKLTTCYNSNDAVIKLHINDMNKLKFKWSNGDTTNPIFKLSSGAYIVSITNSACTVIDTITIPQTKPIKACVTPLFRDMICADEFAPIIACDDINISKYQWLRNGTLQDSMTTKRIDVIKSGYYQLITIDNNNCATLASDSILITVHPLPPRPQILTSSDTLIANNGFKSYRWFKDNVFFVSTTDNYILLRSKGNYCATVIDSNLCESPKSDSIYYIPVSITDQSKEIKVQIIPNPHNEYFILQTNLININKYHFELVDSKGNVIINDKIKSNNHQINTSSYPTGNYFILIYNYEKELVKTVKLHKN